MNTPDKYFKQVNILGTTYRYWERVPEWRVLRFLSSIEIDDESGCWRWAGLLDTGGYGVFCLGTTKKAHRASWMLFRGKLPKNMHIHHLCEVKDCVNPDHLLPVDPSTHSVVYGTNNVVYAAARKTHCIRGHELGGNNVYRSPNKLGSRRCRACMDEWRRQSTDRKRLKREARQERTHCKRGHDLTPDNTYVYKGVKCCRECHSTQMAEYKARVAGIPKLSKKDRGVHEYRPLKTHCKHGHEFTEENTVYVGRDKARTCKTCYVETYKRNNDKKLAAAHAAGGATRGKNCRRGHDLTDPVNVYIHTNGVRECRLCRRIAKDKFRSKDSE